MRVTIVTEPSSVPWPERTRSSKPLRAPRQLQRYADPTINNNGKDRTLRTVFTTTTLDLRRTSRLVSTPASDGVVRVGLIRRLDPVGNAPGFGWRTDELAGDYRRERSIVESPRVPL